MRRSPGCSRFFRPRRLSQAAKTRLAHSSSAASPNSTTGSQGSAPSFLSILKPPERRQILRPSVGGRVSRSRRSTACRSESRTSSKPSTCRRRTVRRSLPASAVSATAPAWRRLREAGGVILGKTVTTEFAWMHPRATRNPWDPARTPGGSSSGSAAAVAVGAISVGIGTQVFGSIVRPSSFCGCFGFKPTVGAINRGGSHDALSQSTHGPIAAESAGGLASRLRDLAPRRRRPRLSGPLRSADLPYPVEASPTCRSGNRRLAGGFGVGEGSASRQRRRNSNQPASRSYRGMKMKRSPRSRTRSTTRASSPTTSSPGSPVGRSTPTARATRANSASQCTTLRRGLRR